MTTDPVPDQLTGNLARLNQLCGRIAMLLAARPMPEPSLIAPVELFAKAAAAWTGQGAVQDPPADQLRAIALAATGLEDAERQRLLWLADQVAEMLSPANSLMTNTEAQAEAVRSQGASLVRGMENLLADLEAARHPQIPLSAGYLPGRDLALTPGQVVLRTEVMELIRYAPQTTQVHARPLLIVPPWINRFYVLDLQPRNSMVRWLVAQGFTVFMISWRNPQAAQRDLGIEAHVQAILDAVAAARRETGADQVQAAGYCIGGTALALALGVLGRRGEAPVASATLMATLIDFSNPGPIGMYLAEEMVAAVQRQAAAEGVLDRAFLNRAFAFLRPNELVWRPAVRRYLMGRNLPRHDLLYWNGDGTNLSQRMVHDLLRRLYGENAFVNGINVLDETVRPSDLRLPVFAVACDKDHITGWQACQRGVEMTASTDRTFVLAEAGHVAGIVNPPASGRYGFDLGGERHAGSWWPLWSGWLDARAGGMTDAAAFEGGLGPAPGPYVCDTWPSAGEVIDDAAKAHRSA
ncbi:PHA/PHB synthase family protein [Falsirhodobacter deserti]|uniref:PHA/PHB synthase family protein n=1 Tax=Falsirhodobacter deserti TaxID=1365611 RepID=UPI000FE34A4B|nr:alpha/beta fold hydrolase [Falsirhodobacter deserti]